MSKLIKIIVGIVVLGALIYFGFSFLDGEKNPPGPLTVTSNAEEAGTGGEVLATLTALNTVSFNVDFFADKAFESLADFSVVLSPGEAGRENPFSPASSFGGSIILPSSSLTSTTSNSRSGR